jgi:tRNA(Ile)-lysidine synthase
MDRDVRLALWRTADLLAAEEAWIADLVSSENQPLPARLPVAELRSEPVAKQRRLLRLWLGGRGLAGIGYSEVELVRTLLDAGADRPAKVNLPGGRHVRRRSGVLFVE